MSKRIPAAVAATVMGVVFGMSAAHAQSVSPQLLSLSCVGCHGSSGHSPGAMPSLYGRPAETVQQMLMDFKNGRRPATIMDRIAKGFSDEEIATLAKEVARWK